MIRVKVKLFGALRRYGDGSEFLAEIPDPGTIADLKKAISKILSTTKPGFPRFHDEGLLMDSAFASESRILTPTDPLCDGTTVAVLPPVCGG